LQMGLLYLYLYHCKGVDVSWYNHGTATCSL